METFTKYSCEKLAQYAGRIAVCLDQLSEEQIWARGAENENAVGNLVLHLCGNVRQWIGFGVAGKPDIRVRNREFQARAGVTKDELKQRLQETVREATNIIGALPPERLNETTRVQGYDVTVLEAVYHVVEHFSHHAGQIIFATKLMTGTDLGFYRHLSRTAKHSESVP
jgi:uncharacterized damage-inducible protein DinB